MKGLSLFKLDPQNPVDEHLIPVSEAEGLLLDSRAIHNGEACSLAGWMRDQFEDIFDSEGFSELDFSNVEALKTIQEKYPAFLEHLVAVKMYVRGNIQAMTTPAFEPEESEEILT